MSKINIENVLEMLTKLIGIENAVNVLNDSIKEANLTKQLFYNESEFKLICENLKKRGGSIKTFANLVMRSEYREKQYQKIINKEKQEKEELSLMYHKMEELNKELSQYSAKLKESNDSLKKVQDDLIKSEKLATFGKLAASMAHELGNPMTSIKNIGYFLSKHLKTDDKKAKEFIELLVKDIEKANSIVSAFLDFSQIMEYKKKQVPIIEIVEQCINSIKKNNIEIVRRYLQTDKLVYIDFNNMKKAFTNFISNACDAINGKGTLIITTDIFCENDIEYARVIIEDTGCGMDIEVQKHLFEPLFSTKTKGIGLGLAIAKNVIERHGGKILFESSVEKGSKFIILLPYAKPEDIIPDDPYIV